uniref:Uncharacterized protein n=1 Tax=Cucumis melo TaxID=3656 RepID=A0A9I9ECE7_CUCME
MDGATSSMRMGDRDDDGWVRGDATTTVRAAWTNTGSDSDVVTQRRWLTERGAA